jgi:hypothetical protein
MAEVLLRAVDTILEQMIEDAEVNPDWGRNLRQSVAANLAAAQVHATLALAAAPALAHSEDMRGMGDRRRWCVVREFRVTFGQKYAQNPHPRWPAAHPDGWLAVLAEDVAEARRWIYQELGIHWCDVLPADIDEDWDLYPRGELGRFRVDEHVGTEVPS